MKRYRATPVRIDRKSSRREINNFVTFLRLFTLHFFLPFFFSAACVNFFSFFFLMTILLDFFPRIIIIKRNNFTRWSICFEIFRDSSNFLEFFQIQLFLQFYSNFIYYINCEILEEESFQISRVFSISNLLLFIISFLLLISIWSTFLSLDLLYYYWYNFFLIRIIFILFLF